MTPGLNQRVERIDLFGERLSITLADGAVVTLRAPVAGGEFLIGDDAVGELFFRKSMLADSDKL